MKFNNKTGKFEITKVVETKVEIDPVEELVRLSLFHYNDKHYDFTHDYQKSYTKVSNDIIGVVVPLANKEWSESVLKSCIDFLKDKPNSYIRASKLDKYSFTIQLG